MKVSLLALCLIISQLFAAQFTDLNQEALRIELAKKVNQLRASKGQKKLKEDLILRKAGLFHSNYMVENNELTHIEKVIETSSPTKRVQINGGTMFENIGENVLYTIPYKFPLTNADILTIATDMFESWKNSPVHYANMIKPDYEYGDFGFQVNSKTGVIYATQVFARKGFQVKNQLSPNAFGIKDGVATCADQFEGYFNLVTNLGNSMEVRGHDIYMYQSDKELMTKLFKGKKDGLAIDLVRRDQVACGRPNQLDMSPVYDGILLAPVYTVQLLGENETQSDYRFITKVGTIPSNFRPEDYQMSIVLIKNDRKCVYLIPGEVNSDYFSLIEYKPKMLNPLDVSFSYKGIIESEEIIYNFKTNDTVPLTFPTVPGAGKKVHSVYIQSFTSIDGDSSYNDFLHNARADVIQRHIQKATKAENKQITSVSKENWEVMRFQLMYNFLDELAVMPNDTIRSSMHYLDKKVVSDWMFQQRRSSATVNYYGQLSSNANIKEVAALNLRTALLNKNWKLANKAIYSLMQSKKDADFLLESPYFEIIQNEPELVQNVSAILAIHAKENQAKISAYIFSWLKRKGELTDEARINLSNLYCFVAYDLLKEWDLPAQSLSNVIKPERVKQISDGLTFEDNLNLNINLTFLNYYGQINDSKNIGKSFDYITKYFSDKSLSVVDEVKLCLFFNLWSRYDLTIQRLTPIYKSGKLNKAGSMLLLSTLTHYHFSKDETLLKELNTTVKKKYPTEWCLFVKANFQLLRNEDIKEMYCSSCSK